MKPPSKTPRGLSEEESAAWRQLAATVEPLRPQAGPKAAATPAPPAATRSSPPVARPRKAVVPPPRQAPPARPSGGNRTRNPAGTLDSHWDKRLKSGDIAPELTLDLHDYNLDAAYRRLMDGMEQARSMGARTVLVVTGRPRAADPADRASRRGAIRAKILDWLAASDHGSAIAAVRKAHQRHGGEGALYLVLKRDR